MKIRKKKLHNLLNQVENIIATAENLEITYQEALSKVHPAYQRSAANLVHYLALRSHNADQLQQELCYMGLPDLDNIEAHVMQSLLSLKTVLCHLTGVPQSAHRKGVVTVKKSRKMLNANTRALFGNKSKKRRARIMVTLPSTAAEDKKLVNGLAAVGMNSARINCAHDSVAEWEQMIKNVKEASFTCHRNMKVMMDLGGPKLRTGAICEGPQVIRIQPEKSAVGKVTQPAKVWLAPLDVPPPGDDAQAVIPMDDEWLSVAKRGDQIEFRDSRDKKCVLDIQKKQGRGRWASCSTNAYIVPGTSFNLIKHKRKGDKVFEIGPLEALEQFILLKTNDTLILHKDPKPGEPATFSEDGVLLQSAHISCTLPEIFNDVKVGEPILFDDGKIEGEIETVTPDEVVVRILHARDKGSKLKADKGINLPVSNLSVSGLTAKDRQDMAFVALNADAVNYSFVNSPEDVQELLDVLADYESNIGIILKIETRKGFNNLPQILLRAMQSYPIGVMIARGDLAVETGWNNIASIQEEVLRICEAAHVPDIWATQVLESMVKKGTPTRAEITDAAASQRAECVMLNKGVYIKRGIKLLDKILRKMQRAQKKQKTLLTQLEHASNLSLEQDYS